MKIHLAEQQVTAIDALQFETPEQDRGYLGVKLASAMMVATAMLGPQLVPESASANVVSLQVPFTESAAARCAGVDLTAHRGTITKRTESTPGAFLDAIHAGAKTIETDMRRTKDGVFIAMHDATVDRTTRGRGRVAGKTYAQIKKIRTNDGQHVPTIDQVVELAAKNKVNVQLEFKENASVAQMKKIKDIIASYNMTENAKITSFNRPLLRKYHHKVDTTQSIGVLSKTPVRPTDVENYADWLLYGEAAATRANVQAAHKAGLEVGVWTLNSVREWNKYLYVDAIATDVAAAFESWCTRINRS